MTIYSCSHNWEAMLTCIYEAFISKKGHKNIKLIFEPIEQYSLFDEYIHVEADYEKAEKVIDAVNSRISPFVYHELVYSSMAYEEDVLDCIYRAMLLGFSFGPDVLKMVQYKDIMRLNQIRKRVGSEAHSFIEFIRFHEIKKSLFVAHIEPKSHILVALAPHFSDRMPSENWMIVDDVHREAIVHPANSPYYLQKLNKDEFETLLHTETVNDEYTDMWKVFFDTIAIKQRINPTCQRNLFPEWKRKHAVEFDN